MAIFRLTRCSIVCRKTVTQHLPTTGWQRTGCTVLARHGTPFHSLPWHAIPCLAMAKVKAFAKWPISCNCFRIREQTRNNYIHIYIYIYIYLWPRVINSNFPLFSNNNTDCGCNSVIMRIWIWNAILTRMHYAEAELVDFWVFVFVGHCI